MSDSPINWDEVKDFYLTCRSYKMTGDKFLVSPETIRTRARRGGWSVQGEHSVFKNEHPMNTEKPQSEHPVFKNEHPMNTEKPQSEHSVFKNEHPMNTENRQNEHPVFKNEYPVNTEATHNGASNVPQGYGLPALPNLSSKTICFCLPWQEPIVAHSSLKDKSAYHAYISNVSTHDCLFSGIKAACPSLRLDRENPPAALLAIVSDYDTVLSDKKRAAMLSRLKVKPNYISRSFSGGTHAVWLLECPIPLMPDGEMVHVLLTMICKELKLSSAFGVLDERAFYNPLQYYHAGWEWQHVESSPIPEARCLRWFAAALDKCQWGRKTLNPPLERIKAEIEARFPGRWQGDFALGSRGVRFWDPSADNPTAAIVTEGGMVCFTGAHSWRSWADIFGADFIEQYRDESVGQMLKECFFVGNNFYVLTHLRNPENTLTPSWQQLNRTNFESLLALKYNLRTRALKGEMQSEARQMVAEVIRVNTMTAALPLIYRRDSNVSVNGVPVLNTSFLRVHPPDENEGNVWGTGFPWIARFIEGLFPDSIQRERFMAAWAYTYRNAYAGHPKNGHILFIAGAPGVGKNFLTECLYGPSLGGYCDASEYLLGRTRFNSSLFDVGVWTCNDSVVKGDVQEKAVFARSLKRIAANMRHVWEGKYKEAAAIDWSGRVCVTLNTDPMSLGILPDIDINNKDKVSLFLTDEKPLDDPQAAYFAREELGALCAWLLRSTIPEHCVGDVRWGVRNYLHPDLLAEATNSGSTAAFRDILALFAKGMFEADSRLDALEGSATWYLQQMLEQDSLKEMLRGTVSAGSIGKRMSALAGSASFPLSHVRTSNQRLWRIDRHEFMRYLNHGNQEDFLDEIYPF